MSTHNDLVAVVDVKLAGAQPIDRGHDMLKQRGELRRLVRGINPLGWTADVMYVPDRENQSHGSSLGPSCAGCATEPAFATSSDSRAIVEPRRLGCANPAEASIRRPVGRS
jgi:hypothetical protein